MAKGRKSKPAEVKQLHGESRPSRTNPDRPQPADGMPRAPSFLNKRATEIFGHLTSQLQAMNLASESYTQVQALAAQRLEEIERCNEFIEREGMFFETTNSQGDPTLKRNPAIGQRNEAMRHLQGLMAEFGASPAAAMKVIAPGSGGEGEDDPWANIGGK